MFNYKLGFNWMGTFGYSALTKITDEFIYCKDRWGKKPNIWCKTPQFAPPQNVQQSVQGKLQSDRKPKSNKNIHNSELSNN